MVRDAVKEGRMKLDPHNDTIAQGAKLPIKLNERGQNAIMPKEQMREKEGIKSPDRFDCYCFSMLVSYTPANMLITEDMKNERESVSRVGSMIIILGVQLLLTVRLVNQSTFAL